MVVVLAHSALFWTFRNVAFFILRMTVELVAANLGSGVASPQTSVGVRLSRIHFDLSAGRLGFFPFC